MPLPGGGKTMKRLMTKTLMALAMTIGSATAIAGPSSLVAWSTETRALIASGDTENGAALAKAHDCGSCHGPEGIAPTPYWPSLAGQLPTYLYKQMKDYQDGTRKDPIMQAVARELNDRTMADMAAYYASLPIPASDVSPSGTAEAEHLVKIGDGPRLISGCRNCHGRNGEGNVTTNINIATMPVLVGQYASYLERTMQAYKTGDRANDVYSRMRSIAAALSDEEIRALAEYYGTLDDTQ